MIILFILGNNYSCIKLKLLHNHNQKLKNGKLEKHYKPFDILKESILRAKTLTTG